MQSVCVGTRRDAKRLPVFSYDFVNVTLGRQVSRSYRMEASPKAEISSRVLEPTAPHTHAAEEARKWIVAASVILCTILEVLDSSIVNVALPHMQGSFSATIDEVTWVVTTYLVAGRNNDSDDWLDCRPVWP